MRKWLDIILVPVLAVVACLGLALGLPWVTWVRFGVWLVVGLLIYFMYGRSHSVIQRRLRGERVQTTIPPRPAI